MSECKGIYIHYSFHQAVHENAEAGSTLHADEHSGNVLALSYDHETANHGEAELPGKPINHIFFVEMGTASMTTTFRESGAGDLSVPPTVILR